MPASLLILVSGCSVNKTVQSARDFTPGDFCTDLMRRAYPQAEFDIADQSSRETGLTTVVVSVSAKRTDVSTGGELATHVGVECSFDHNVLTSFRWTEGPFRSS